MLTALLLTIFPLAMIFAAVSDLFTMTIPNRISIVLGIAFCVVAPMAGFEWQLIAVHALTAFVALIIGIAFFSRGWIGGGDAKLFAATALWVGHGAMLDYALTATLIGGALTLAILFARRFPLPAPALRQDWLMRLHDSRTGIPYGIALAAAGLIVYPHTPLMLAGL